MRSHVKLDPRTQRGTPVVIATAGGGTWTGVVLRSRGESVTVRVTSAPAGVAHVIGADREFPIRRLTLAPLFTVVYAN